jgi:AcrR family transcriptional regulator
MSGPDPYLLELAEQGFREGDAPRFVSVWERLEVAYFERIAAVAAPFSEWRDRFRAAATETAALIEAFPAEARFLAVDALAAGQLGRDCQQRLASRIAELLDAARRELPDPDAVPESTSSWIVAIFFDRLYRRYTIEGEPDLPSQLSELMFLAISAYFGTEAGLEELIPPA